MSTIQNFFGELHSCSNSLQQSMAMISLSDYQQTQQSVTK